MNGQLYDDYKYMYEQYCKIEDNPIDQELWITLKWYEDLNANAETRDMDPDLIIEKLLREGEKELLDVVDHGMRRLRAAMDKDWDIPE